MRYIVYGPFEVTRSGRLVSRAKPYRDEFWERVEAADEGLSGACGCYVFSIRGRAWYVGQAERQGFKSECFAPHKINQYNEALEKVHGRPSMLFIARVTPQDRFSRPGKNGYKDVRALETLLIGAALGRNRNLQNVQGTMLFRELRVPGFMNTAQGQGRAHAVQQLKKVIGV